LQAGASSSPNLTVIRIGNNAPQINLKAIWSWLAVLLIDRRPMPVHGLPGRWAWTAILIDTQHARDRVLYASDVVGRNLVAVALFAAARHSKTEWQALNACPSCLVRLQ